jgi:hypothetical protein
LLTPPHEFSSLSKAEQQPVVLQNMHKEIIRRYQPRLKVLACYTLLHSIQTTNSRSRASRR